jgi:hypothetical protein
MAVTEIICGGVLLSVIGVIGIAISRPEKAEEETPDAKKSTDSEESHVEMEALRARNKVRRVEDNEEGTGVDRLPRGVYGFSFSPHQEIPLFRRKMFRSFEVHKLADGTVHLVGFVTEKEYMRLAPSNGQVEVMLYPDPYEESMKVASVALDRVARATGPSRDYGNFLKLEIGPATV